jgi:hypothetical protein
MTNETTTAAETPEKELKGIGGWLVLMAIGMVVGPLRTIVEAANQANFTDSQWVFFKSYPFGVMLAYFEIGMIWALVALSFTLSYLFFMKSRYFPKAFIFVWLAPILLGVIDITLSSLVLRMSPLDLAGEVLKQEQSGKAIGLFIGSLPWVIYLQMSRRVENTFVE